MNVKRLTVTTSIPSTPSDRSRPKAKTLLELASEREASLRISSTDGKIASRLTTHTAPTPSQTTLDAILTSILYATTLSALHLTLTFLVAHQYAQTPPTAANLPALLRETVTHTSPAFFLLVLPLHTQTAFRFPLARQVLLFLAGVAAGARLVWVGNLGGVYCGYENCAGACDGGGLVCCGEWVGVECAWGGCCGGLGLVGGVGCVLMMVMSTLEFTP